VGDDGDQGRRSELASFLRSRRAALLPQDGDRRTLRRRRVPGLRRDEVAQLAGISVNWYARLEQGGKVHPTPQVLDSLARALRLDADERAHLRRLGGHPSEDDEAPQGQVDPDIGLLLEHLHALPACVFTDCYDYLAWNTMYTAVFGVDLDALPPSHRNGLWLAFATNNSWLGHSDREDIKAGVLAQFRFESGRHSGASRFTELVAELSALSPEFRSAYAEHRVHRTIYRSPTVVSHPQAGPIRLRTIQLRPLALPELLMSIHVPYAREDAQALATLVETPPAP
jgi:transcriptional regulator with XRE-family HTH domain